MMIMIIKFYDKEKLIGENMKSNEECRFYSDSKCLASDLENCDFEGEHYEKCIRYRVYCLRPQTMQLR
jgi:hypothetical protein